MNTRGNVSVPLLGYASSYHTLSRMSREFLLSKADLPETIWQSLVGGGEASYMITKTHLPVVNEFLTCVRREQRIFVILQFILSQEWK